MAFSLKDLSDVELALSIAVLVILCGAGVCVYCCLRLRTTERPTINESFKWPSSSKFLKSADPAHPPEMVVEKYEDPIRTEAIPIDCETHWTVMYQPNGYREEVKQCMYLRFRAGAVYGIGFEDDRKLCKISGKYKQNQGANQTALAMTCKFSSGLHTVVFHGSGNGTGLVGNCYIREVNQFSMAASVPGLRHSSSASIQYKGSFLMLKMPGMGDPRLRTRLHMRRVHKWAGPLFPDDSVPLPGSPMHSRGTPRNIRRKVLGVFSSFGRRKPSMLQPESPPTSPRSSIANELPPWVRPGSTTPEGPAPSGTRRPTSLPINTLNYLEMEGVPGRSGPSMV